eukprot:6788752-Alexandrium_andersonii.AAC.1
MRTVDINARGRNADVIRCSAWHACIRGHVLGGLFGRSDALRERQCTHQKKQREHNGPVPAAARSHRSSSLKARKVVRPVWPLPAGVPLGAPPRPVLTDAAWAV